MDVDGNDLIGEVGRFIKRYHFMLDDINAFENDSAAPQSLIGGLMDLEVETSFLRRRIEKCIK